MMISGRHAHRSAGVRTWRPCVFWKEAEALARARDLAVHQRVWIEELTGERWHCPKEVEPEVGGD